MQRLSEVTNFRASRFGKVVGKHQLGEVWKWNIFWLLYSSLALVTKIVNMD